jgi:hypothetical protein
MVNHYESCWEWAETRHPGLRKELENESQHEEKNLQKPIFRDSNFLVPDRLN